MHAGIEILLERMKTHPEEFYRASRWCNLIADFIHFLTADDKIAFENGVAECRRTELTQIIMDRLVTEEREDKEILQKLNKAKAQQITQSQMQEYNNAQQARNQVLNQALNQFTQKVVESLENVEEVKSPTLMQSLKKAFF
jgi:hypothetical protein